MEVNRPPHSGHQLRSTSVAGLVALANEQAIGEGDGVRFPQSSRFYAIGQNPTKYAASFHDIQPDDVNNVNINNNTWSDSPDKFYAVTGYDLCTGWGTPAGQGLINALTIFNVNLSSCSISRGRNPSSVIV